MSWYKIIVVLSACLAWAWDRASTPAATLAELVTVELGGHTHYATIRSRTLNQDAPVLLILHGGPGDSDIPYIHHTDALLEEHFVVAHYDQRSAGKSCRYFDFERDKQTLTIQQHVEDAVDMIQYLRERFNRDKIYLLGGSWGTQLATLVARDYPQLLHHVAVRGIAVNLKKNERLSYDFVQSKLPEFKGKIAPPPYNDRVEDLAEQRGWLHRAGGSRYRCTIQNCTRFGFQLDMAKALLMSPEMSFADVARFKPCFMKTLKAMRIEAQDYDAMEQIKSLSVPFLALHGIHDRLTSADLVPAFLDALEAPSKELVWFNESGHSPQIEEPLKFQHTLIETFLRKTL